MMSNKYSHDDIKQMMGLAGLPDTILHFVIDPDTGENYIEDPQLASIAENLRTYLQEFLLHLGLIEQE